MKEKTYKRIKAVRKAGEILKHLGQVKEPSTGPEIAKAVGLAVGTAMCHLATLEDVGFVQRVGDASTGSAWRIGMGLALIWARVKANLEGEKMLVESQIKELDSGSGAGMTNKIKEVEGENG